MSDAPLCARDGCRECHGCIVTPEVNKATKTLQTKLVRAELDRDHYKKLYEDMVEKASTARSAAASAAQSTVTAIERIQEMEKVVNAAEEWALRASSHAGLVDAVRAWQAYKKRWS